LLREVTWRAVICLVTLVVGLIYLGGVSFQLPLWLAILVRLRIATHQQIARCRRYMLLAAVIVAALVTPTIKPTTDVLALLIVAVPLYLLYELGLLLAYVVPAPRHRDKAVES
jgi:sec-independent protein translocase protein TatC